MKPILIIGYGNTLRADDGLGPHIAAELAALRLPGVRVLSVPQLLPELAAELAEARRVVFVDACAAPREGVQVTRLEPVVLTEFRAHGSDPATLLGLARSLYGRMPTAWLVAVAGYDFGMREGLSALAEQHAIQAQAQILELTA